MNISIKAIGNSINNIISRILKMSCHLFSLCLRNADAIRVAMDHTLVTLLQADIADSSRVSAAG